jgi:16S rRNA processing protein RimM
VTRARSQLLELGATVTIAGAERQVERRAGTDEHPIVRLTGGADRNAAEALRGAELLVPRGAAPELDEDEFWAEDLEGCTVRDGEAEVGVVRRMLALPSCEVLEVRRPGRSDDLLVPLVRDAVRAVDVEAGVIDVDLAFLGEDEA